MDRDGGLLMASELYGNCNVFLVGHNVKGPYAYATVFYSSVGVMIETINSQKHIIFMFGHVAASVPLIKREVDVDGFEYFVSAGCSG
jgi:hypothetical protein